MAFAVISPGRFQDHRNSFEAGFVEQRPKGREADLSLSQIGVAIAPRGEGIARVVEMDRHEAFEAEHLLDLVEKPLDPFLPVDRVAGGEGVARIQTEAERIAMTRHLEDPRQLLEAMTEDGALSGCVLEQEGRARILASREDAIDRAGDSSEALLLTGAEMRPGVDHQSVEPEHRGTPELLGESRDRPLSIGGVGGGEVDEIGAVGHHTRQAGAGPPDPEALDLFVSEPPAAPLTGTLDEDLAGPYAELGGPLDGAVDPTGARDVGSQQRSSHGGGIFAWGRSGGTALLDSSAARWCE